MGYVDSIVPWVSNIDSSQVIGLLATLLMIPLVLLYFRERTSRSGQTQQSEAVEFKFSITVKARSWKDYRWSILLAVLVLILAFISFVLGFADLQAFSMCLVGSAISLPMSVLVGSIGSDNACPEVMDGTENACG